MVKGGADAEDGRTTPCKLTAAASSSSSSGSTGHGDVAAAAVASGGGGHHHGDAWMAPTALFHHCFCCSLLTGAVLTGVYATAVYIVAFALEVWLITEAADQVPTPSYVLCVGYFITWTMSVAFLVGLALRRTKPILAWLLTIIVLFFPECGLVLFMSLYHWTLDTSFGMAELIFLMIRVVVNVAGMLCVFSLYTLWKEEKNVNRRLRDLTMTSPLGHGYYTNIHVKTPLPGSLRAAAGYHNAAYLASETNLRQMHHQHHHQQQQQQQQQQQGVDGRSAAALAHSQRVQRMTNLHRSTSSLSYVAGDGSLRVKPARYVADFGNLSEFDAVLHRWQQKQQQQLQVPGMAYGPMGIAGVGLDPDEPQPPDAPGMAASGAGGRFRTQSLLYIDDLDNYWNRPPLSRPISTALIVSPKFASPSFDRQSQFVTTSTKRPQPAPAPNQRNVDSLLRRAHSMNDLNVQVCSLAPSDVNLQRLGRQPFSYLPTYNNSRNSLGAESDDLTRYKDVAL